MADGDEWAGPAGREAAARQLRRGVDVVQDVSRRGAELPWRTLVTALVILAVVCGAGIALYFDERNTRQQTVVVGPRQAADRIDVHADVQRTDPVLRQITVRVTLTPFGRYQSPDGYPTQDLTLYANTTGQQELRFPAGSGLWVRDIQVPLSDGASSDYPFDKYTADFAFAATAGSLDTRVPVLLRLHDQDPNFAYKNGDGSYEGQAAYLTSEVKRSRSTFILAWFMIAAMWAVALSIVTACWLVVGQRRGLLWPALGWMAASLFALVGLRNAAPGSPPNGCLLDYLAFYWAEALIVLSLTVLVFHGIRIEHGLGGPVTDPRQDAMTRRRRPPRRRTVPAGHRRRS
ncbi:MULTISPECIES: DUF4436 family protein [unclassified Streptomyces]|uniref:DUF4436 family protein n=1 Tax=unclassified Streptomyces TaxID=2593676 RepID=UPI0029AD7F69|nr:DUF4436 family protein [Streptomyces sp. DK15]MDX2394887.1 DUF4436 domain-containing protein [Streptomyces sp. DK15]